MIIYSTFPQYFFFDATNQILGRFTNEIISFNKNLYKNKNYIILIFKINYLKINVFKKKNIKYYNKSNRPGNLKSELLFKLYLRLPKRIFEITLLGMLQKNKQRFIFFNKLHIFNINYLNN